MEKPRRQRFLRKGVWHIPVFTLICGQASHGGEGVGKNLRTPDRTCEETGLADFQTQSTQLMKVLNTSGISVRGH
jgi:hypothetical protein